MQEDDIAARHEAVPGAAATLSRGWIVALAVLAAIVSLATMNLRLLPYDESIIVQGAINVGAGLVPHRDFYFNYGPAQLWIIAGLFSLFGVDAFVPRLYDIAVRALIVALCAMILRRMRIRVPVAVAAVVLEIGVLVDTSWYLYPVWPVLSVALGSTLLLVPPDEAAAPSAPRLFGCGMLAGVAALFRYETGFLLAAAQAATLAWFWAGAGGRFPILVRRVLVYAAGALLVFAPVVVAAWLGGVLPGFRHDIIDYSLTYYARMRGLPFPRPHPNLWAASLMIVYVAPLAVLGALVLFIAKQWHRAGALAPTDRMPAALSLLSAALFVKGLVRLSPPHVVMGLVPAIVLLAGLVSLRRHRLVRRASIALAAGGAASLAAGIILQVQGDARGDAREMLPVRLLSGPPAAMAGTPCPTLPALGLDTTDRDSYRAACYIATHSAPAEAIFVAAGRHDKLFINNIGLYAMAGRRPGTHWYHFDPGLQTRADIQERMIRDLEASHVRLIAADSRFDDISEPNESARSSGVHLLDAYIRQRYRPVAGFGTITIFERSR